MSSHDKLRAHLLNSAALLFSGESNSLLLSALKALFPSLSFALVVNWIPEQAEDIYWVLIDLDRIAVVEIPRSSNDIANVSTDVLELREYQKRRLSAESRQKLEVAIELMRERA